MNNVNIPEEVLERVIARQGRLHAYESLVPGSTALLVVDMQNYFMADGELVCCPQARGIVPNVNRLAAEMRDAGGLVVWIQGAAPDETLVSWANLHALYTPEKRELRRRRLSEGSPGYELWAELDVAPQDLRIVKSRYSAFIQGASGIESLLHARGMDTVIVTGVATNVCCESTARDAMMLGFRTLMVSDANAAFTDDEHNAALASFFLFFGDVQSTDEVVAMLRAGTSRTARGAGLAAAGTRP